MTRTRITLLILFTCLASIGVWLWWNQVEPADMTGYAPADALIYVEANSLPEIARAMTSGSAWRALAEPANLDFNSSQFEFLTSFAARTGIGTAEAVVGARAQIAVVVIGVEAVQSGAATTDALTLKPQLAVVVETHTGERRARAAIERVVGGLARRVYGEPRVSTRVAGEVQWTTWAASDGRRQIIAAEVGSTAIVGNDLAAVEKCLAVRRGERPSLQGDADMLEMRRRTAGAEALAFGYVSPANAARLLEIGATVYAARLSVPPKVQSTAATLLPQVLPRVVGSAAWSAHANRVGIEDRFLFRVDDSLAARLRQPLLAAEPDKAFAELLPAETAQVSAYYYRDPEAAWRGAQAALSTQLDFTLAPLLVLFTDKALEPYGIEKPREFLQHIAPGIATARIDADGNTLVLARVRDREALTRVLRKRFNSSAEKIGDELMLLRKDDETEEAALFISDRLIMGEAAAVRRCFAAHREGRTLASAAWFKSAPAVALDVDPLAERVGVATYKDEREVVRETLRALARLRPVRAATSDANAATLDRLLAEHACFVSETRLVEGGFEKRTRSVFGMFGSLITELSDR